MAVLRCPHPDDKILMVYWEGPLGEDFPVWECSACGLDVPDTGYITLFRKTR